MPRDVRSRPPAGSALSGSALDPRPGAYTQADNSCATKPDSSICYQHLSGPSVGNADFTSTTVERITAAALPAGSIGVEITESTAIGNLDAARSFIGRLRDIGCTTALDDFGTGLSSLAYLRALPVAKLKIDGSFVRDLLRDARAESMVRAMLQLARQLRIETVAECIETPEVATRLALLGVVYGQGFHFSEPVPLERILEAGSRMHSLVRADVTVAERPSPARRTRSA